MLKIFLSFWNVSKKLSVKFECPDVNSLELKLRSAQTENPVQCPLKTQPYFHKPSFSNLNSHQVGLSASKLNKRQLSSSFLWIKGNFVKDFQSIYRIHPGETYFQLVPKIATTNSSAQWQHLTDPGPGTAGVESKMRHLRGLVPNFSGLW